MTHQSPQRIAVDPSLLDYQLIGLDGGMFVEDAETQRWVLATDDTAIDGDWADWVALANHIVAIDEIDRREENGDIE